MGSGTSSLIFHDNVVCRRNLHTRRDKALPSALLNYVTYQRWNGKEFRWEVWTGDPNLDILK